MGLQEYYVPVLVWFLLPKVHLCQISRSKYGGQNKQSNEWEKGKKASWIRGGCSQVDQGSG